jgi:hypothetical protein
MAEIIAADGAQQVRGAGDVWASDVHSVQGFGNRASGGSGGIAGAVILGGAGDQKVCKGTIAGAEAQLGEAEDVVAAAEEGEIGKKEISGGGRRFRGRTRGGQQRPLTGDAPIEYRRQREQLKDLKK